MCSVVVEPSWSARLTAMGITGLLPLLNTKKIRISEFSGKVAAVDTYCWLHKGASLFAEDVVIRKDNKKCIELCAAYLDVLEENNITPIVVMDGRKLEEKIVNENRARARDENLRIGLQMWNENRRDEARHFLKQGANVSTKMALELIELCRERGIDYIVAPFEADAQIAFLQQNGYADMVITEDSDLLVYGCDQVIFKFRCDGSGDLVDLESVKHFLVFKKASYTHKKFQVMCVLSGCDYLKSLKGIGIKKAKKVIEQAEDNSIEWILDHLGYILRMPSLCVPESYKTEFKKAVGIFKFHPVLNPVQKKVVNLCSTSEPLFQEFVSRISHADAIQIAIGNVCPQTLERHNDYPVPPGSLINVCQRPRTANSNTNNNCSEENDPDVTFNVTCDGDGRHNIVHRSTSVPKGKLVTITALRQEISWTIPSFSVLTLTFMVVELECGQFGVIKSGDKFQLTSLPATIDCWSTECEITIGINSYTVLWDWELWLHNELETQSDKPLNDDFLDSLLGLNELTQRPEESSGSGLETQSDKAPNDDFLDSLLALNEPTQRPEESSSSGLETQSDETLNNDFLDSLLALNEPAHRPEESSSSGSFESDFSDDEESNCSHELPFKVMGVVHSSDRQKHLENAFETMFKENEDVLARIRPEPTNKFDADAIAVEINYGSGWKLVGFLLKDLTQYVHPVLRGQRLLGVRIGHIRFQTQWQTPGFYVKILIKRKGMWPKEVISASKRAK